MLQVLHPVAHLRAQQGEQQPHQALAQHVLFVQDFGVRVELEEVQAVGPHLQELEVGVRHLGRVEWRRSEGQDEEQDSEREDVRHLGIAWGHSGVVDLRSHVRLSS